MRPSTPVDNDIYMILLTYKKGGFSGERGITLQHQPVRHGGGRGVMPSSLTGKIDSLPAHNRPGACRIIIVNDRRK
jgi:hypothetical protein